MNPARRVSPEPARRGWCPSLARPMPTGDGLLARVHPALGVLSLAGLRAVTDGARAYGNGHVDVTARANLQIRGVGAGAGALAAALAGAGLGDRRGDGGPQRLTLTSPLAGLDPAEPLDVPALARAVEAAGRAVEGLPAKTLVAVAGPGVDGAGADLVLHPLADGRVLLAPAGGPGAVVLAAAEAPVAVAAALRAFVRAGLRRVRDLPPETRAAVVRAAGEAASPEKAGIPPPMPAPALALGATRLGGTLAVAVEAPFGRCDVPALERLAAAAAAAGADEVRLSPGRGFVLVLPAGGDGTERILSDLAAAGFVTRADDPRRAVAACPGAPACASGSTPVPEHAARLAEAFAPFAARGRVAHLSGCAKGCAHPGPADLTLVAEAGRYRIVPGGGPGDFSDDESLSRLTFEAALERVRRADPAGPRGEPGPLPVRTQGA